MDGLIDSLNYYKENAVEWMNRYSSAMVGEKVTLDQIEIFVCVPPERIILSTKIIGDHHVFDFHRNTVGEIIMDVYDRVGIRSLDSI